MFINLLKFFWSNNQSVNQKPVGILSRVDKICRIAKEITGEKDSDRAISFLKRNRDSKINFFKALKKADEKFYEDRIDARYRDLTLTDKFGVNKRANIMLTFVCISLFVSIVVIVCFKNLLSPEMLAIFTSLVGVFSGCLKEAFHFEFGGRFDSKRYEKKTLAGDEDLCEDESKDDFNLTVNDGVSVNKNLNEIE